MTYQTSDLGLTAALALYYHITSIDRSNPGRVVFIFEGEDIEQAADDYFSGTLKVSAVDYFAKVRQVKTLLYQKTYLYK